ncbi:MAG: lipoprotein insertase outer membrane protein LolB [Candidatus Porifericomitaceae bacterium WSBS_2022_MAG_OTU9]
MLVSIALCSCAVAKPRPPVSWQQHSQQLNGMSNWRLQGRISIRDDSQAVQANISWEQKGRHTVIQIYSAFGLGSHELHYGPEGAQLRDPEGHIHHATSIQELMQDRLGWSTPPMFSHWLRGLPGSESQPDSTVFDQLGRLAELGQEQWQIEYLGYGLSGGIDLPTKIRLQHTAPATIVIAIHNWETTL